MKRSILFAILFSVALLHTNVLRAQSAENETGIPVGNVQAPTAKKTTLTILGGAIYAPKLHYFGRVDSLQSSALLPTLFLQFDSAHLYASGTAIFLDNVQQSFSYAGTIAEAGYRFGKQRGIAGNIFVNKFFYNTTSLPQSSLKEQAGINLNYLNKVLNVTTSVTAAFSNRTDFFATAGLNHVFKIIKKDNIFLITPTAVLNAGTQKFTQKKTSSGLGGIVPGNTQTEEISQFNILSYDFSLPLVWAHKKLFLIATPTYVVPQNLLSTSTGAQTNEMGKNLFFVNVSALYSLKL